jgi:hypothetical protein
VHSERTTFNTDRAQTLASLHRVKEIMAGAKATVMIQAARASRLPSAMTVVTQFEIEGLRGFSASREWGSGSALGCTHGQGTKRRKRPADLNRRAFDIVRIASAEAEEAVPVSAAERARKGGPKGGKERAAKLE